MYFSPRDVRAGCSRFAAVGLVLLGLIAGCKQQEAPKQEPLAMESVALCRSTTALLPMVVAEKQGFFAEQGLTVTVREFSIGRDALEGMRKGECALVTAAEPPVVEYAAQGDFRILCSLQTSENSVRIVARADRSIAVPEDLRGKRIGVVKGTNGHYFLDLFLERHGLHSKDAAIVFMKSDELLGALTSGQIDAISITGKVLFQAQEALGDKAVLMEEPGLYRSDLMLLATTGLLEKRPGVAVRFLRAMDQAVNFVDQRPQEAQAIVQASEKVSSGEIKQLLEVYQYRLSLSHSLLLGLEDTARWTLQQHGDSQLPVPNFLNLIADEPLRTVKPDSVRLEQ